MKRKVTLGAMLFIILAGSLSLSTNIFGNHSPTASASYDPIAVGHWQQDQFDSIIVAQAQQYGLDPFVIKGQIMLESAFNQWAVSNQANPGCGWTHDIGLMQINPYCNGMSVSSLYDAWTNIHTGTYGDARMYWIFGDIALALQAYNIGAGAVEQGYRNWAYSNAVLNNAQQFRNEHNSLYGGGGGGAGTYVVKPGDTLSLIGQKLGVSWQAIASANHIYSPYIIYPGQVLNIPSGTRTYVVQAGDTLIAIANRYGTTYQAIAQANGIHSPYIIYPGETLTIP